MKHTAGTAIMPVYLERAESARPAPSAQALKRVIPLWPICHRMNMQRKKLNVRRISGVARRVWARIFGLRINRSRHRRAGPGPNIFRHQMKTVRARQRPTIKKGRRVRNIRASSGRKKRIFLPLRIGLSI